VSTVQALKRVLVGRPMSSGELEHTLLPKTIALPVFSSDPLSSVAYATQEIMLVLGLAGAAALSLLVPISFAVAGLLAIVVVSYRQTVRAYPSGGGAYIVAHDNLGRGAGLLAASALLIDYVMTVSVSITAGVDAIVSARPDLRPIEVEVALGFVALVALANLRGAKESGTLFAIPTYGFVASIYLLLASGFVQCLGGCPQAESAGTLLEQRHALDLFLILKAFSAGTTALTGVEAISNGVPAFRYPQSRNAATTLAIMGTLSISMFLGISWLARHTGVVFTEEAERTVVAQIAHTVFRGGPLFYLIQVMTALILILAANTAYQDFPRLASILARDGFMPRQFVNRGDRLVFSNGIFVLTLLAALLIVVFDANLNRLIQLYLVGVFVSFTLSQWGMVVHWRRTKERGWRRSALINGFGGTVTAVVLCVVVATKFSGGAWIVVAATPLLMLLMRSVHRHYDQVAAQLTLPERRPRQARPSQQHMVVLVERLDAATARAVGYVRSVRPADVVALTFDPSNCAPWKRFAPDVPIEVGEATGTRTASIEAYLRARRAELPEDHYLTLVVPELLKSRSLLRLLLSPSLQRTKAALLDEPGIQVLNVPVLREHIDPGVDPAVEPSRNYVCVLVSGVHNATLQAIEYAETLRPTDLRAVTFSLDPEHSEKIGDRWLAAGLDLPLEIEDSPFRDIGRSLTDYVRRFKADGKDRVVTVVLPEFVVSKRRHQLLHGQTALLVKRHLIFERGVVVVSVPYHL
jgi:amino acid transporter